MCERRRSVTPLPILTTSYGRNNPLIARRREHCMRINPALDRYQPIEVGAPIGRSVVLEARVGEVVIAPRIIQHRAEVVLHFALPFQMIGDRLRAALAAPIDVGGDDPPGRTMHE